MAVFLQGDIVIIDFPFTDGEGSKSRPAVVVSGQKINKTQDILLAQMTTAIRNDEFSFPISSKEVTHDIGYCEVRTHKIFLIEKSKIKRKISKIRPLKIPELMKQVVQGLT